MLFFAGKGACVPYLKLYIHCEADGFAVGVGCKGKLGRALFDVTGAFGGQSVDDIPYIYSCGGGNEAVADVLPHIGFVGILSPLLSIVCAVDQVDVACVQPFTYHYATHTGYLGGNEHYAFGLLAFVKLLQTRYEGASREGVGR